MTRFFLLIGITLALNTVVFAQPTMAPSPPDLPSGRIFTLYGKLIVIEPDVALPADTMFDLILYARESEEVARQRLGRDGRYSFNDIIEGNYFIGVEIDNVEIARVAIHIAQRKQKPIEQDLQLNWTSSLRANRGIVSAPDAYNRSYENRKLFEKAM